MTRPINNNNDNNKKSLQHNERHIATVSDRIHYGKDMQADDKYIVLEPGHWSESDPFLLMAEDWFSTNGFDWHPHRGIETITVVLEGELEHHDSHGGHGVLKQGDVQWMTAGRGVLHREMAHHKQPVHTLQLWLNLPAEDKMVEPAYQDLRGDKVSVWRQSGVEVRVFSGRAGNIEGSPGISKHVPVTMLDVRLDGSHGQDDDTSFIQEIPAGDEGFVYVLSGQGQFGSDDTSVDAGQVGHLAHTNVIDGPTQLNVTAKEPMRFLLWTGRPLRQPVVAHGPFVMNTENQIAEAFSDYKAGLFGPISTENT
ncbi:MAG TPA: pirin family protein [Candidatus Acidoferrum sp.]|nr:pirin family protein [Candidatus Acidoferrum sp.]